MSGRQNRKAKSPSKTLSAVSPSKKASPVVNTVQSITSRKEAEDALVKSERRFRALFEKASDLITIVDVKGMISYVSPNTSNVLGYDASDLQDHSMFEFVHPDDREPAQFLFAECAAQPGATRKAEIRVVHRSGAWRWLHVVGTNLLDDPAVGGIVMNSRDITTRVQAEEELLKANRALTALGHSGQALLRANEEPAYLKDVCKIIVEDCGYAMVWVGFAESDKGKSVRPAAWSGFEDGYLETLKLTWADTERGRGPTGTAIRTGQVCRCLNMLDDPKFMPWREQAIKRGYASSIALPLMDEDEAFGVLTIYSPEPNGFADEEVKLLTDLAADFAYGITTLRLRTAKERAEAQVLRSQKTFAELVERSPFGIYIVDSQFRIAQMNVSSQNGAFQNVRPVIGRAFSEAMHILWSDPVAEEIIGHFRHTLDTGEPYYSPRFTNPRHDEAIVESYEWELHRITLSDGHYGVICYFFDSTKLRETEASVRESEERERQRAQELATVLDATPTPVFIVHDPDSVHMTGNRAADELLRLSRGSEISLSAPAEVRPHHFKALKDGRELTLDELPAQRAARGEHVQGFEFSLAFDDGMNRQVLGYGTPLLNDQRRPRGAVHVLVDITERKRAEEEIRRRAEELRVANEELTRFNRAAVGRELRMIELKKEVNELSGELGRPTRYVLDFDKERTADS